jgi:hypothetical protein
MIQNYTGWLGSSLDADDTARSEGKKHRLERPVLLRMIPLSIHGESNVRLHLSRIG